MRLISPDPSDPRSFVASASGIKMSGRTRADLWWPHVLICVVCLVVASHLDLCGLSCGGGLTSCSV